MLPNVVRLLRSQPARAAASVVPRAAAATRMTTMRSALAPAAVWSRAFSSGFLPKDEVTERVMRVVKNFQNVDPAKVSATSHFTNDLGLDSLDTVEVVMAFEDEFAVEIPDAEAEKIHTVAAAVEYLSSHPQAK